MGKCSSPTLTHRLRRSPLSRRDRVILSMMDSATPPCGCAQNDGMVGDVQGSFRNEGRVRSCSRGADSSELPLLVCAPHKDRAEGLCFRTFPTTFRARFLELPMEATSIHKITIRLLTPENLIPSLPACHSARRAFMPEVAESTVSKSERKPSPRGDGARQGG
ncbi:MAG: hypothetical protein VYC97_09720 [SAR324 cluster bacterium]|nr:hypothetical protein [SAR324 cluster bacterium]